MNKATYKIERGVLIPRSKIHPNPWNPNHMKPRVKDALDESLNAYGQVLELLVRPYPGKPEEYQIIDGEHRFKSLPDTVYCNVIHGLTDPHAKKLTIILNETKGEADKIELAGLLSELSIEFDEEEFGLAFPYDDDELKELVSLSEYDWDSFDDSNLGEFDSNSPTQPKDGFQLLHIKLDDESMDKIEQAKGLVTQEIELNKDKAIAWGQVITLLASQYLQGNN